MRKLIAMVAIAAGLMLGSVANAAQVDIFLTETAPGSGNWELTVDNNGGVGVGAINMLVSPNLASVLFNNPPNTNISIADSSLTVEPIPGFNFLIVQNTATGVSIVAPGVQDALLATLSGLGPVSATGSEVELGSDTVFDAAGGIISDYSITVVPEPTTTVLLGLGLAALALVRRSA